MKTKQSIFELTEFKALDGKAGTFEAIVSVFGNVDAIGDRVVKGAFSKTLDEWRKSGAPIPVIWSHNWGDPYAHIGAVDPSEAEETPRGLKVKAQLDVTENPLAGQVYRLMEQRRVTQFSFGYQIVKERTAQDGANELVELDLIEVGPTLRGMNPSTELLAVKSELEAAAGDGVKAGPWHVEGQRADGTKSEPGENVDQWVIVSDPLGSVIGTHSTKAAADRQLAALVEKADDEGDIDTKAGRRISRATEAELRGAIEEGDRMIGRLRALLDSELGSDNDDDDDGKAEDADGGNPKGDADNAAELSPEHIDLVARIAVSEKRFG